MDEAAHLRCPHCGADRIIWLPAEQTEAPCPQCGQTATVEHPEPTVTTPPPAVTAGPPRVPTYPPVPAPTGFAPAVGPGPGLYGAPVIAPVIPRQRDARPMMILLALSILAMTAYGILQVFAREIHLQNPFATTRPAAASHSIAATMAQGAQFISVMLILTYVILLLVWIYRVHRDLEMLTYGRHCPTPGLAMGLLFVPVVHSFWLCHVLRRLSQRASGALPSPGHPPAAGRVQAVGLLPLAVFLVIAILQVLSLPVGLLLMARASDAGEVSNGFLIFQTVRAGIDVLGIAVLAVALYSISNAVASFVAEQTPRWLADQPQAAYVPPPYGYRPY
jgi:hypothetical protein